jgi:hypothetical protein
MYLVDPLFAGPEYRTTVLISEGAAETLDEFSWSEDGKRFVKKLREYARNGFRNYTGGESPIRYEWDGVFRICHRSTLFRLIGFYVDQDTFIVIDGFEKHGTKLRPNERARIDRVAEVKGTSDWRLRG